LPTDQQTRVDSKRVIVEQVKTCLQSGDYSRAVDLLRGIAVEFPNDDDTELSELKNRAQDGIERRAEADRLITQSQELFAQQRSSQAIQLLRKAHELDKKNSLARAILANALVEHARSFVETDWLEAEKLANQALALNPAHPTARTILSLIVEQKTRSSVEDWVAQARKLQSSGDLFAALAWVAEGLAVHPHEPKLLQIQDAVQRDQDIERRHARRRDMEDLRRMEVEINGAADLTAKQALAKRIQAMAAKYWTDGAILTVANSLLQRLGIVPQSSSTGSPRNKNAAVIFHVPRPSAPNLSPADSSQASPIKVTPSEVPPNVAPQEKILTPAPEPRPYSQQAVVVVVEPSAEEAEIESSSPEPERPATSNLTHSNLKTLILVSAAAAIIAVAATLFFAREHYAPLIASAPTASAPTASAPDASASKISAAVVNSSTPTTSQPSSSEPPSAKPSSPALRPSSGTTAEKVLPTDLPTNDQPTNDRPINDRPTRVSKGGFQDPAQQQIHIRKGEQAKVIFNLQSQPQPQPRLASLTIQGGVPGTAVFVDQTPVGTIQPDGALSVSTVNPGDHIVELRKDKFKLRQFKEHFVAGAAISLAAADAALEVSPGELKITFTPADASVAIVKGERLTMVSSGVPLNLSAGTYTLTARTADGFRSSSTLELVAGQSKVLDLSLAPSGMSKWDDPGAWKHEKDSFIRKGGNFVLYGVVPASGTFVFSAMPAKGHLLQWILNYTDPKNYVLFQMDDDNFYRTVIRNGEKTDRVTVPDKSDKKGFRVFRIRVSPTEIVHQIGHGDSWTVLDRWTQPGTDLSSGKFGFYLPGDDQVALSSFAHYADLNIR
jgi:tetratricopeptide (TPR) repeat protein